MKLTLKIVQNCIQNNVSKDKQKVSHQRELFKKIKRLLFYICFSSDNYLFTNKTSEWFLTNANFQVMMHGNEY